MVTIPPSVVKEPGFKQYIDNGDIKIFKNIASLKNELEAVKAKILPTKEKVKEWTEEVRPGKYHVIDVKKFPDEKLAGLMYNTRCQLIKQAMGSKPVDFKYWQEYAYDWIMNQWWPTYLNLAKEYGEKIMSEDAKPRAGMHWFWVHKMPSEEKRNSDLLKAIRTHLRERFNKPTLDWGPDQLFYIEEESNEDKEGAEEVGMYIIAGDNPDPSADDAQTSPMEENFENRAVDPASPLYRGKKGRGYPMGDPSGEGSGELKCNLPASVNATATDVVERYMISREKDHASEDQIKTELQEKGLTATEIANKYKNRDKNLYKETL
jgi:hypothetical protein